MITDRILSRITKKYARYKEFQKYKEILGKNAEITGTKAGRTCFIMGNGPSLKDQNLTLLADKDTFIVNSFWRHPQYKLINPKYYVAADFPHLLNPSRPRNLQDEDLPASSEIISQVPQTKLFLGITAKKFIEENRLFPNNSKYYILQNGFMDEGLRFNLDPIRPIPFTKNTVLLALILAVNMGYETIYLLGCEHNFLDQPPKKWFYTFKHFYEEPPGMPPKESEDSYETGMQHCLKLFRNYRFFKEKIAKLNPNIKIYNATPESFLDVFPFVNFEDIVNK